METVRKWNLKKNKHYIIKNNLVKIKIIIMTKPFAFILLTMIALKGYSQTVKEKINNIGISIPIIWNNSEATFYRLGSPKYPRGKAISYGININHSRSIYRKLYGIIGAGYFKQAFGIKRPFRYASPNDLGYATDSYKYHNAHLYGGLGWKLSVAKAFAINGNITYNQLYSFRQKYVNSPVPSQINNESISIGRMINLSAGMEKKINGRISIGLDATIPLSTHWNDDDIFIKYGYSDDTQQIARNKFSIGTIISCNYHF